MNRSIQILSIFFLLGLATAVSAQTCGIVNIDGPADVLEAGTPLVFKVKVTNISSPQFKWNVSVGTITKGQGTDEITVDSTGLAGQEMTATVELIGARLGCNSSASRTAQFKVPPPTQCSFDSYGDIKFEDEKARLDNFAIQVTNLEGSIGLIQMSAGQETFEREAADRLARAKAYLTGFREIDPNRIMTVDCGFTQELTARLWVFPLGAPLPECNTVGEIPFSEVKFTKPRPKSSN